MRTLEKRLEKHIDLLIDRYPVLSECKEDIIESLGHTKEELEKKYEHLRKSLMYHRLFGMGRIIRALARKGSMKYQDILDKLRFEVKGDGDNAFLKEEQGTRDKV